MSQLKTIGKWKKQPGDATLPTTKTALKQLLKKVMNNLLVCTTPRPTKRQQVHTVDNKDSTWQLLKKTMNNPSPHVSPINSDANKEAADDASDNDLMDRNLLACENDNL
jgi:hypothetical protein